MLQIVNNKCPICGCFLKIVSRSGDKLVRVCNNTSVDHDAEPDDSVY
ncbi:hypothetical protein SEA_PIPPA_43 [Arthrobacter phage Pippa]|nr:hypothetical protein SEA_PIPPA_43 [Arthrobacter phage Pippa]